MVNLLGRKIWIALSFLGLVIATAVLIYDPTPDVKITGGTTIETKTLATCLQEKSVKVYGSLNCASCKEQKELFSEEELDKIYVECGYLSNFVKKCKDMSITEELTWVINDKQHLGLKTESELRTLTNC